MSKRDKNELTPAKILAGAIASPVLMVVFSDHGINICTGLFLVMTLISWYLLYLRVMTVFTTISDALPRHRHTAIGTHDPYASYHAPHATLPEPPAEDDSRSLFL